MTQLDATMEAKKLAKANGFSFYVIEGKYGWGVSQVKPSLRYGKVFEIDCNGIEHYA